MQRFAKALIAAASLWGISTLPAFSTYLVNADNFSLTVNGSGLINDTFSDGSPPPSGPLGSSTYVTTNGTFTESNSVATMDESLGSSVMFAGRQYIHHNAILPIRIGGDLTPTLAPGDTFAVEGLFDLFIPLPSDTWESYGVMLTDRAPGNAGNDQLEMRLVRRPDGHVGIQFAKLTYAPDTVSPIAFIGLSSVFSSAGINPLTDNLSDDELLLRLAKKDSGSNAISASYAYFADSAAVSAYLANPSSVSFTDFSTTQTIFTDENYTRAGFFARHSTSVPEPASIAMFAFGLVMLCALHRRRRCIQCQ